MSLWNPRDLSGRQGPFLQTPGDTGHSPSVSALAASLKWVLLASLRHVEVLCGSRFPWEPGTPSSAAEPCSASTHANPASPPTKPTLSLNGHPGATLPLPPAAGPERTPFPVVVPSPHPLLHNAQTPPPLFVGKVWLSNPLSSPAPTRSRPLGSETPSSQPSSCT